MTIQLSTKGGSGGSQSPYYNEILAFPGYTAGKHYQPSLHIPNANTASGSISAGTLVFMPFIPESTHVFTGISVYNADTAANGNKFRLGVYDNLNGKPDSLILDAGEVTLDATAALRTIVISESLTSGVVYWLAAITDASINFVTFDLSGDTGMYPALSNLGFLDFQTANPVSIIAESRAYGVLPLTVGTLAPHILNAPWIFLEG